MSGQVRPIYRDPNGRAARKQEQRKEKSANVTAADRARAAIEIVLWNSGDVPHPRRQAARKRPDIAATAGGARRASPPQTIHGPSICCEVTPEESELRSCSQNPRRTGRRRIRLIRSRRRRAYDSAGLPGPPGTSDGDAASRAQAVAPITTAPITAKTCRQRADVMVRPERPKVAW